MLLTMDPSMLLAIPPGQQLGLLMSLWASLQFMLDTGAEVTARSHRKLSGIQL